MYEKLTKMNRSIYIIVCSCLLLSMMTYAQSSQVFVANAAIHVLYRGHKNPIQVAAPHVQSSALAVECDDAIVAKDKNGVVWTVTPNDSVQKLVLKIYNTANGKKTLLKEQVYKVTDYPELTIMLLQTVHKLTDKGSPTQTSRRLTDLRHIPKTAIVSPAEMVNDFPKGGTVTQARTELIAQYPAETMMATSVTITAFTAVVMGREFRCEGNMFSQQAIELIAKLKKGDQIRLTDIRAVDADGLTVAIAPCSIILK